METFVKGDIVVVPFPFSDLSHNKRRPALVPARTDQNDLILCQITSRFSFDDASIELNEEHIAGGELVKKSFIRPNKIFTADQKLILYKIGTINSSIHKLAVDQIMKILT